MSNLLRFQITQKEFDDASTLIDSSDYVLSGSYTDSMKQTFTLQSGNVWKSIAFGQITNSTGVKIITDSDITIKLNGGSDEIAVTSSFILLGDITSLNLKNNSGSSANIQVEIYGD